MNPHQYCYNKTIKSNSNFYYSFLFLTPIQKKAITAIYAFCKEVDNIVDNFKNIEIAIIKIKWWLSEIDKIYLGTPNHPIGKAISNILPHFNLKKQLFIDLIIGMKMDLITKKYETLKDLLIYSYHVAGTVGILAANIFGFKNPKTLEYALFLGKSFQIINIIRDVNDDALLKRIYLPQNDLKKFSINENEILYKNIKNYKNFKNLLQLQAKRARFLYKKAIISLPKCDRYKQRSGLIMGNIYLNLLAKIESNNFNVLKYKIKLTPMNKFWIACKTIKKENKLKNKI